MSAATCQCHLHWGELQSCKQLRSRQLMAERQLAGRRDWNAEKHTALWCSASRRLLVEKRLISERLLEAIIVSCASCREWYLHLTAKAWLTIRRSVLHEQGAGQTLQRQQFTCMSLCLAIDSYAWHRPE